jgi:riboflavin synthase
VQGHVDGVGRVQSVKAQGEWRVRIGVPRELVDYFVPQGSVCVAGVSLTVANFDADAAWFEVTLIPTTLSKTTLGELRVGQGVNIECDVIGKQVVAWMRRRGAER